VGPHGVSARCDPLPLPTLNYIYILCVYLHTHTKRNKLNASAAMRQDTIGIIDGIFGIKEEGELTASERKMT
jgi:hypothetical protein